MSHITAQFLGKSYNLACDAGQEEDLAKLAQELGERLGEMEMRFQQQGHKLPEAMLWVMTSLTLLDEIHDLRRDSLYWQQAAINTPPAPMLESERKREVEQVMTETLNDIAARLERIAE
jgi:cell division protein ZapA (FtsZ GTPase activity inhibitor)